MHFNPTEALKEKEAFLKSVKENKSKYTQLKKLYEYIDEVGKDYSQKSICKKGCSYCCKIPVLMSRFEADYIVKNTKYDISINLKEVDKKSACPFLNENNDSCEIYEYRPLACRTFFTYDDSLYCKEGNISHMVQTLDNYPSDVLKILFEFLISEKSSRSIEDIRNYFKK